MRRLAITQRIIENQRYPERRDALAHDWVRYLQQLFPDVAVIPVPNGLKNPGSWIEAAGMNGLILSNGNDWGTAPDRDQAETELYGRLTDCGVPILGVCRGLQVINVIEGGSLARDLSSATEEPHVAQDHEVRIVEEAFRELAGRRTLCVNSFHNQGIKRESLAPSLRPFALTKGAIVEGLFHPKAPVLAIQWHPERPNRAADFDRALIRCFFERGAFWR